MLIDANSPVQRAEVIQDFARSELFERTFHEGMQLVEETAGGGLRRGDRARGRSVHWQQRDAADACREAKIRRLFEEPA